MKNKMILAFILLLYTSIYCMHESKNNSEITVYAIPGQNGLGSDPSYVRNLLNQEDVIAVQTPLGNPDFGQNKCLAFLRESISANNKKGLIHATSQGTAT